jgi:hypothetical protein
LLKLKTRSSAASGRARGRGIGRVCSFVFGFVVLRRIGVWFRASV